MKYLSVCSGIEAATVAWHPLGWEPVAFAEIDPFASALLAHHYPDTPNLGDMTSYENWPIKKGAIDVLVGGTPCQSFSVAGLRRGLADPRGNLALTYLGILDRFRPRWCVWENVPGVLSSNGGRDFGAFLGALGQLGYGFAYRVLDAQYVRVESHPRAVPQRRKRVFVVGHLGNWRRAAEVLFEPEGVRGNSAPRREAGKGFARGAGSGSARGGQPQGVAFKPPLSADADKGDQDAVLLASIPDVCGKITDGAHHGGGLNNQDAYSDRIIPWPQETADPIVCAEGKTYTHEGKVFRTRNVVLASVSVHGIDVYNNALTGDISPTLRTGKQSTGDLPAVLTAEVSPTLSSAYARGTGARADAGVTRCVVSDVESLAVRRLTPRECERLQGFPDDYTLMEYRGKPAADGNRYKALGNSMAVNVMRFIGERIALVEARAAGVHDLSCDLGEDCVCGAAT